MKTRLALGALGVLVMAYAVAGILADTGTDPLSQAGFLVALLLAHDLVLLPAGVVVGALVGWRWHSPYTSIVRGGLWTSAIVCLIAVPFLVEGRNLSPRNFPAGLLVTLAAVWLAVGGAVVVRRLRR
ncbi:hypothetical protein GCM10010399_85100 [Dactylosporangium fulvum]|uniref:Integral membrane protein n=1 Tax=Dactylosporangium fulvum TaxID=53359 RepID=A0ABY5W6A8_9ACTN|nr:hypothetical protein [Dactylosporangium fulvum]UWP84554.1 hypothetical protein Dfulv_10100 [Dactylosporangium fulvum]